MTGSIPVCSTMALWVSGLAGRLQNDPRGFDSRLRLSAAANGFRQNRPKVLNRVRLPTVALFIVYRRVFP